MKGSEVKISYVVPVYNGAQYLHQCLDSIYAQGLDESMFEVICVDDCSKDNSLSLLQAYASKHSNVRIIEHSNNMRKGTSCNDGFRAARGEYVWTVDQDDWVDENWAQRLLTIAEKEQLDVLLFNYNRVSPDGQSIISRSEVFQNSDVSDGAEFVRTYFRKTPGLYLMGYCWRALYRREYLQEKGISFPEGVIFEDTTFMFKAIWRAKRVKSISDFVYNYRLNSTSITDNTSRYKGFLTYDYSCNTSAEILSLSNEVNGEMIAQHLRETAIKSMKSFANKVVYMDRAERTIFYNHVQGAWGSIKDRIHSLPLFYRVLLRPYTGRTLAAILKPAVIIKSKIRK